MDFHTWNQRFSNLAANGEDELLGNSSGFHVDGGNVNDVLKKSSQSLVLDEEEGELVKGMRKTSGKKLELLSDDKTLAALKSHSDAERRRRERINAHLDTLRGLVPRTDKMDKATLLAEVIRQVKQLKVNATKASTGLLIPEDTNELKIEKLDEIADDGILTFHASFCCKYRPELLTDLRGALAALRVNMARAELSTLGDHVKIVFDFTKVGTKMTSESLLIHVREALTSVLENAPISPAYSPRKSPPNKRRRYSL